MLNVYEKKLQWWSAKGKHLKIIGDGGGFVAAPGAGVEVFSRSYCPIGSVALFESEGVNCFPNVTQPNPHSGKILAGQRAIVIKNENR